MITLAFLNHQPFFIPGSGSGNQHRMRIPNSIKVIKPKLSPKNSPNPSLTAKNQKSDMEEGGTKKTPGELFRCHVRTKSDVPTSVPLGAHSGKQAEKLKDKSMLACPHSGRLKINCIPEANSNKFIKRKVEEKKNQTKNEAIEVTIEDESKVALPHKTTQKLTGWHKRCGSDSISSRCNDLQQAAEKCEASRKQTNKGGLVARKASDSKPKPIHRKHISDTAFLLNKENTNVKNNKQSDGLKKGVIKVTKSYFANIKVLPRQIAQQVQKKALKVPKEATSLIHHIKNCKFCMQGIGFRTSGVAPPTTTEFYRIGRLLGKGAFGKVNLGMHRLTGEMVAIKSLNREYMVDEGSKQKVMQEYSILKRLQHSSVIRLYETFESKKHILFVIELCAGGDLLNYVRRRRKLKENVAKFVFKQLIEGLQHCHSRSVLHRDIKLDNILLNSKGKIKICDFGVSKLVRRGERMAEQCGTPAYIAPEILLDKGYEGFGVDIWSAGIALHAMLYGKVPFKANNMRDLNKMIMKGSYSLKDGISPEAKHLLTRMLEVNPKKRITTSEVLKHSWLADVEEQELFTEAEKVTMQEEYSCRKKDETLFTEQNIDSTQSELTSNITDKSLILAPFNTTQERSKKWGTEAPVYEKKEVIQFGAKARDADRQYEKNNNGDLDNGVYNDMVCVSRKRSVSSCDSIDCSFENESKSEEQSFDYHYGTNEKHEVFSEPTPLVIGKS